MTTATPTRRNGPGLPAEPETYGLSLERQAVRFLIGHRLGRLLTSDPATGEPRVTPVHYVLSSDGALVTHLPADSEHVQAIRRGGKSMLSVHARHAFLPQELRDEDGQPTPQAVKQVQASVSTELIVDPDRIVDVLRRQVWSVLENIGQESESDAAARVTRSALAKLVVVRMQIEAVNVRLHQDAVAA